MTDLKRVGYNPFIHTRITAYKEWLPGFNYRIPINITGGVSGTQTNFQLKITVPHVANMLNNFNDLRFTQADGKTPIDAWLESKIDGISAVVWVEFPTTPANGIEQTYFMYYGNSMVADSWDGDATFIQYHGAATSNYHDSLIVPNTVIYESRFKPTSATFFSYFGLSNVQDIEGNPDDAQIIVAYTTENLIKLRTINEGTQTTEDETGAFANGIYYKTKIINTGSAVTAFVDDNQIGTADITTTLPDETMGLTWQIMLGTVVQDWAFARKYAANPPTYSFNTTQSY